MTTRLLIGYALLVLLLAGCAFGAWWMIHNSRRNVRRRQRRARQVRHDAPDEEQRRVR
jgi:CHASE3 domain sensor protein